MTVRPTDLPEWATDGTPGQIVEPSLAKKVLGWVTDEKPPAQFFNWWKNKVHQWIEHYQDIDVANWTLLPFPGSDIGDSPRAIGVARGLGSYTNDTQTERRDQVVIVWGVETYLSYNGISGPFREVADPIAATINDVIHVPSLGIWVAVGNGGAVLTRADDAALGANWTVQSSGVSEDLLGVALGNVSGTDTIVAVGRNISVSNPRIITSTDAVTWTPQTADYGAQGTLFGVIHDPSLGLFVAAGGNTTTDPYIETSPDGVNWTLVTGYTSVVTPNLTGTGDGFRTIATDGLGNLIAGGQRGAAPDLEAHLWRSNDGTSWTRIERPPNHVFPPFAVGSVITKLVYARGRYFAGSGAFAGMMVSRDRVSWRQLPSPSGGLNRVSGTSGRVAISFGGSVEGLAATENGILIGMSGSPGQLYRGLLTG